MCLLIKQWSRDWERKNHQTQKHNPGFVGKFVLSGDESFSIYIYSYVSFTQSSIIRMFRDLHVLVGNQT